MRHDTEIPVGGGRPFSALAPDEKPTAAAWSSVIVLYELFGRTREMREATGRFAAVG